LLAEKAAVELAKATGGNQFAGLLAGVGKIATQLTEAAETRNWLMLPDSIRIKRITLEPGEHHVTLNSEPKRHHRVQQKETVTLRAGETTVWQVRTMPNMPSTSGTVGNQKSPNPDNNPKNNSVSKEFATDELKLKRKKRSI